MSTAGNIIKTFINFNDIPSISIKIIKSKTGQSQCKATKVFFFLIILLLSILLSFLKTDFFSH